MSTHLQEALVELRVKRDQLTVTIAAIEDLLGEKSAAVVPVVSPVGRRTKRTTPAAAPSNENGHASDDQIVAYLRTHGESSPKELQLGLRMEKLPLRRQLKALAKQKLVVLSGKTASRRVALPASPGKEAP